MEPAGISIEWWAEGPVRSRQSESLQPALGVPPEISAGCWRLRGHLLRPVNNINLRIAILRSIGEYSLKIANLIDLNAGSIRLNQRKIGMVAMIYLAAFQTLTAGIVFKFRTKQSLGKRKRRLHLSGTMRAAKQIGMTDRITAQGILSCFAVS